MFCINIQIVTLCIAERYYLCLHRLYGRQNVRYNAICAVFLSVAPPLANDLFGVFQSREYLFERIDNGLVRHTLAQD